MKGIIGSNYILQIEYGEIYYKHIDEFYNKKEISAKK